MGKSALVGEAAEPLYIANEVLALMLRLAGFKIRNKPCFQNHRQFDLTAPVAGAKKPIAIKTYRHPLNRLPFVPGIFNLSNEVARSVAPNHKRDELRMGDFEGERTHQLIDRPTEMKKP